MCLLCILDNLLYIHLIWYKGKGSDDRLKNLFSFLDNEQFAARLQKMVEKQYLADVTANNLPAIGISFSPRSNLNQPSSLPKSGVNSLFAALGNSMLPAMVHISTEV